MIPFCLENPLVARELQALIEQGGCPIIFIVPGRDEGDKGAGIYISTGASSEGTPREKALVAVREVLERTLEEQFELRACEYPTCPESKLAETIDSFTKLSSRRYWLVVLQSDCEPPALHIWYDGSPIRITHFEALERITRLLETLPEGNDNPFDTPPSDKDGTITKLVVPSE